MNADQSPHPSLLRVPATAPVSDPLREIKLKLGDGVAEAIPPEALQACIDRSDLLEVLAEPPSDTDTPKHAIPAICAALGGKFTEATLIELANTAEIAKENLYPVLVHGIPTVIRAMGPQNVDGCFDLVCSETARIVCASNHPTLMAKVVLPIALACVEQPLTPAMLGELGKLSEVCGVGTTLFFSRALPALARLGFEGPLTNKDVSEISEFIDRHSGSQRPSASVQIFCKVVETIAWKRSPTERISVEQVDPYMSPLKSIFYKFLQTGSVWWNGMKSLEILVDTLELHSVFSPETLTLLAGHVERKLKSPVIELLRKSGAEIAFDAISVGGRPFQPKRFLDYCRE